MFKKAKNFVEREDVKQVARQLMLSFAMGVAVTVTSQVILKGVDIAAEKIAEGRQS